MQPFIIYQGAMPDPEIQKLYYSIGEVSRLTGLDAHVLRYWETEFRELSPRKNRGGKRLYREGDIKLLLQIKELLYDKRYTIKGAQKALHEAVTDAQTPLLPSISSDRMEEIRNGLIELKELIDNN